MFVDLIIFIVALVVLDFASNMMINSSLKISRYFKIAKFAIGFILVSVTTSLPELAVSITAGLQQQGGIVFANIIGSNITNILLVLGAASLVGALHVKQKELVDSAEILLLITLLPLFFLFRGSIGWVAGLFLIFIFIIYLFFISKQKVSLGIGDKVKIFDKVKVLAIFFFGLVLLLASAHFLVGSAVNIATQLNILPEIIALTVIAFGTSLPELVFSVNAARRNEPGLALGNVLGSCVVNLTLVLGVGVMLVPILIDYLVFSSSTLFLISITVFLTYILVKFNKVRRRFGLMFLIAYIVFLISEIGLISII